MQMHVSRFPDGTDVFEVTPFNSRGEVIRRSTYVRAGSEQAARRLGRRWLRILGLRGKFHVRARIYNPLNDPEMRGYVRPLTAKAVEVL